MFTMKYLCLNLKRNKSWFFKIDYLLFQNVLKILFKLQSKSCWTDLLTQTIENSNHKLPLLVGPKHKSVGNLKNIFQQ